MFPFQKNRPLRTRYRYPLQTRIIVIGPGPEYEICRRRPIGVGLCHEMDYRRNWIVREPGEDTRNCTYAPVCDITYIPRKVTLRDPSNYRNMIPIMTFTESIDSLSDMTRQWLRRWKGGGGYDNSTRFNKEIATELKPYRMEKPSILYRVVSLRDMEQREAFLQSTSVDSLSKLWGGNITLTTDTPTSWSYNEQDTIEVFSYSPEWDWLLMGQFQPEDSLADLTHFPSLWGESEVVIAPGTYRISARGLQR